MIKVDKIDNIYVKLDAPTEVLQLLYDRYAYRPQGYNQMPRYKDGEWDGYIRMIKWDGRFYMGLVPSLIKFANENDIPVELSFPLSYSNDMTEERAVEYFKEIATGKDFKLTINDHQIFSFVECINNKRLVIESATGSGKSFSIYALTEYFRQNHKILIIVPKIALVKQLYNDFKNYKGSDPECHQIHGGKSKDFEENVCISTWQSIVSLVGNKKWMSQFTCVICDEVHRAKAKSISNILKSLNKAELRFGFTGTIDQEEDSNNSMTIEGMIGEIKTASKAHELIKEGKLSKININVIFLKYPQMERFMAGRLSYQDQIDFINRHEKRWNLLKRIAKAKTRNSLILFSRKDKFGVPLYEELKRECQGRPVYLITSKTKIDERERIRCQVELDTNAIILATYSIFAEGINIRNLYNLIGASATASEQRIIQSIGRILRIGKEGDQVYFDDLVDDLSQDQKRNYFVQHAMKRFDIYDKHRYPYRILNVKL